MPLFIADGITFTALWGQFTSVFSSVSTFIGDNPIFLAIIGVPLGVGFLATIIKALR